MKIIKILILLFCSFLSQCFLQAQQTLGLLEHSQGSLDNGYVLFAPIANKRTFLIDKCGNLVHSWMSAYRPAYAAYLLPDGTLLRMGDDTIYIPKGGLLEKIDWDGNVIWSYKISSETEYTHHDVKFLPNGNILLIVHDEKSEAEAIAAGRNPSNITFQKLSVEKIIEIQPIGTDSANIVWEWKVWDHLIQDFDNTKPNFGVVADAPQLINLNFTNGTVRLDWLHCNSIDYNPEFDQIMISLRNFDEIWIIDHSTTTVQAASHSGGNSGKGGDLLYRWGNPSSYNHGSEANHKFFAQHDARWINNGLKNDGKIIVFNNGENRPSGNFSSVEIISPPVDINGNYSTTTLPLLPTNQDWIYTDPILTNFYSATMSGAQMLSNGNILVCNANEGSFFELDTNNNKVWVYQSPISPSGPLSQGDSIRNVSDIFKCTFYPYSYSGFSGRTLTAGNPIELNPLPYNCILDTASTDIINQKQLNIQVFPNPAHDKISVQIPESSFLHKSSILFFNNMGQSVKKIQITSSTSSINVEHLPDGIYFYQIFNDKSMIKSGKIIIRD